jgi:predicted DNA-binding protein
MATTLTRTTVFLTNEQREGLRRIAFEQHVSMAKLLRDAAEHMLEDEEDIRVGVRALSDEEGTVTWEDYTESRGTS